uniref:Uncharacterized protein n=1 Tax=Vespula pensylvanica TaxID=30213 RepID=A0A834NRZ2_VESPE|nr:hypothetical protein H0235_011496 [Vespula pensylvanica]
MRWLEYEATTMRNVLGITAKPRRERETLDTSKSEIRGQNVEQKHFDLILSYNVSHSMIKFPSNYEIDGILLGDFETSEIRNNLLFVEVGPVNGPVNESTRKVSPPVRCGTRQKDDSLWPYGCRTYTNENLCPRPLVSRKAQEEKERAEGKSKKYLQTAENIGRIL